MTGFVSPVVVVIIKTSLGETIRNARVAADGCVRVSVPAPAVASATEYPPVSVMPGVFACDVL